MSKSMHDMKENKYRKHKNSFNFDYCVKAISRQALYN